MNLRRPFADGRSTRWDEHRQTRRTELVEATLRAIRRHGSGVGMDEIATEAGTSKTVLYRHFGDKSELYLAVTESVHAVILRDLQATLAAASGSAGAPGVLDTSPRATIAAVVDAYLHLVEADPEVYRFVVTRPLLDRPVSDDPNTGLVTLIGDQVAGVLAANGHPAHVARTWGHGLVGMVRAAADHWIASPDRIPRAELVGQLTDLAWGGLSAPATHRAEEAR